MRVKKQLGVASDREVREAKKKFIFGYEGAETEVQYFKGISNHREELGINKLIEIINLERRDISKSNQLDVVKEIDSFLKRIKEYNDEEVDLRDRIKNIFCTYDIKINEEIEEFLNNEINIKDKDEYINKVSELLENEEKKNFLETIESIKTLENIEFGYDEINIILDRDFKSFTEEQFKEVIDICKKNNYNLGLTNPCFEFWLLLHHTDCIEEFDIEEIKLNPKISSRRNYLGKCLVKKLGSYKKDKIRFEKDFKDNIPIAIKNAEKYCRDVEKLKDNVGSSVGDILIKMTCD
ncbi:MAG: RloB family protein [Clostridium perfringens]|nr:RloB family protein [Clostridium perfringens]